MAQAPIMPFYTDAYLGDTHHLTTEQHGIYLLLLLYIWRNNGIGVRDDDVEIAKIVRLPLARWKRNRSSIMPFFHVKDGVLRQKRLDKTWEDVAQKIERQREKGKRSAEIRGEVKLLKNSETVSAALQPSNKPLSNKPLSNKPDPTLSLKTISSNYGSSNYGVCERVTLPCPNLSYLTPYLTDFKYFTTRGTQKRIDVRHKGRVEAGVREAALLIIPITSEAICGIVQHIFRRYPAVNKDQKAALMEDFMQSLRVYPHDMLQDVLQQILNSHTQAYPPLLGTIIEMLEPQMQIRRFLHKNVMHLYSTLVS